MLLLLHKSSLFLFQLSGAITPRQKAETLAVHSFVTTDNREAIKWNLSNMRKQPLFAQQVTNCLLCTAYLMSNRCFIGMLRVLCDYNDAGSKLSPYTCILYWAFQGNGRSRMGHLGQMSPLLWKSHNKLIYFFC